jgi:hypothetical protein
MSKLTLILLLAMCAQAQGQSRADENEQLLQDLQQTHALSSAQIEKVRAIFAQSRIIGQGNPAVTHHPMTPAECTAKVQAARVQYDNLEFERICGGKFLAPLYNPAQGPAESATECIDQFEFPNIPCAYPVVWVKAKEAAELCEAEGERLCDAHEWEGACDGQLLAPDYHFDRKADESEDAFIARMRAAHNREFAPSKRWSYGPTEERGICAEDSTKTPGCNGGDWKGCGSNTYPAGAFPACHSPLQVYDLNGNAAEHMNLPLALDQMSSRGSTTLGVTEMKGSWFIFDTYQAHPDWCRWRAPFWHGTRVLSDSSHANYHLGFRCCKSLPKKTPWGAVSP